MQPKANYLVKALALMVVWLAVGAWWFEAGGTYGLKQEATREKDKWLEGAATKKSFFTSV